MGAGQVGRFGYVFGAGIGLRRILALHCSLAHGGAFGPLAEALPEFEVTAPDMIGHGRAADWDGRSDIHTVCTRDAIAAAEGFGGPVDIIGHSFGATVALRMALERGELVRSLTLIEPVLFAAARADEAAEYRGFAADHAGFEALMRAGDVRGAAAQFQRIWGDGTEFDALPAKTQDYIAARIHLIGAQTGALAGDSAGIMGYLRLQACPAATLLIVGTHSPPIIGAIARALAARLPNVQTACVAGARHMAPITHAGAVAGHIRDFLARR